MRGLRTWSLNVRSEGHSTCSFWRKFKNQPFQEGTQVSEE